MNAFVSQKQEYNFAAGSYDKVQVLLEDLTTVEASRSLLVITPTLPSNVEYDNFTDAVNAYNEKEPFNFRNPFDMKKQVCTVL